MQLGQRVINRYGCFSCHEIKGFETTQPIGTELSEEGTQARVAPRLRVRRGLPHTSKLAWFRPKLHDPRVFDQGRVLQPLDKLRMPNFDFTDEEVERLLTAIMSFQREIQPAAGHAGQVGPPRLHRPGPRRSCSRRNCVGCHIIEGNGGDFLKLVEDPTLGPPILTPEGARVQHDWLYAFLRAPITIRPWLDVRMPTFGFDDPNLNSVISYFGAVSNKLEPSRRHRSCTASANDDAGKQLFDDLKCQQCHVLGAIPKDQPTSNLAPDLRMAPERLQPDWIIDWLKNPATILPGTRMPAFWPELPEVVLSAARRRRRGPDSGDSRLPADVQGWSEPDDGTRSAN